MAKKPVETISVPSGRGAFINASIWENEVKQDGDTFTTYSVTLEKRYQKDDEWKSASSFNANEMLAVGYVANKAYEEVLKLRNQQSS